MQVVSRGFQFCDKTGTPYIAGRLKVMQYYSLFGLIMIALLGTYLFLYLRNQKVTPPAVSRDVTDAEGQQYGDSVAQYYEGKREQFLDWLYSCTSSPEIPVQVKLRDWVKLGFYAEGGNYWGAAQQFTYYLIEGGYVIAFDTVGSELSSKRVLRDRPDTLQLTPSEYQRRNRI